MRLQILILGFLLSFSCTAYAADADSQRGNAATNWERASQVRGGEVQSYRERAREILREQRRQRRADRAAYRDAARSERRNGYQRRYGHGNGRPTTDLQQVPEIDGNSAAIALALLLALIVGFREHFGRA